ncbi:sodium-dependent phosphate transporter 1-B-like [Phytophthora cinnamomi]|uniref:sodium-dependent phosphate transporter 1-B-like n=1 Tax=Phytophthora cinnamomi TaxID=4785 RepID=UPI003559DE82|nr:sodium-dependent phosphate transporter 1-B-like [Phytophthora cinnamomi]
MLAEVVSCAVGVFDCAVKDNGATCANYDDKYWSVQSSEWMLVFGFIVMAGMAWQVGANDVANAFGTSVGSRAISCKTACLVAGAANWLGAVSLGYGVSSTIQSGVADVTDEECWACGYCDSQISVYALGMLSALFGGAFFMFVATHYAMPVSTTHAIVGAIIGITIVGVGGDCLNWKFKDGLAGIVSSWGTSPVLSGITGVTIYLGTHYTIMGSKDKVRNALWAVPVLYGLSTFFVFFMIFLNSVATKGMHKSIMVGASAACCLAVAGITQMFLVPYIRDRLPSKTGRFLVEDEEDDDIYAQHSLVETPDVNGDVVPTIVEADDRLSTSSAVSEADAHLFAEMDKLSVDEKDAMFVFRYLLVMVATLESFAHGANDTANATGPVAAIFNVYDNGYGGCSNRETPVWIMAIAGCFVCLGIIFQGAPVMETIGKRISHMDMHRGFAMELSSTVTVVIATLLKLPVSTTHCQVGSVVFVSLVNPGWRRMSFPTMGKILLSWLLTVPTAGAVAAFLTMIFRSYLRN